MKLAIPTILLAAAAQAAPVVTDVTLSQPLPWLATITYRLTGEAAIVTLDIQTNGVSIGAANVRNAVGDVWKEVAAGDAVRTIYWRPEKSWAGNRAVAGSAKAVVTAWALDNPPDYMVVDLEQTDKRRYYPCEAALPGGIYDDRYRKEKMVLRRVPAANVEFTMGSAATEAGRNVSVSASGMKENAHAVTLTNDFYMGVFEVTQRQYEIVATNTELAVTRPSAYAGADRGVHPVESVSYNTVRGGGWPTGGHAISAGTFMAAIRAHSVLAFDLPTEAQWEFACRAGTYTMLNNGNDMGGRSPDSAPTANDALDKVAWTNGKSSSRRVGELQPNAWGLYDMHGNVFELCLDRKQDDLGTDDVTDPSGAAASVDMGVRRGGAYNSNIETCRAARRSWQGCGGSQAICGFRLVVNL